MGPELEAKIINILLGIAVGAVVAMLVGFKLMGWTTASSAQTKADAAVLETQSAICAAQFMRQPNNQQKLKEYALISSNDRADFIEKGGWDRMPGQEKSSWGVSRACATGLDGLIKN